MYRIEQKVKMEANFTKVRVLDILTAKEGDHRPFIEVEAENYWEEMKKIKYCCEYMPCGKVKVYLDWDDKEEVGNTYGSPCYIRRYDTRSVTEQIDEHLRKLPLFQNQPYTVLYRSPRIHKEKVKYSYRIIFDNLITDDYTKIKDYMVCCGLKNDKPFDFAPYKATQTIHSVGSVKQECDLPIKAYGGETNIRKMLITCVDDNLEMVDWNKWIVEKPIGKPKKETKYEFIQDDDDEENNIEKVKLLLTMISAKKLYPAWFKILTAIKCCLGDNDKAYKIADDWSATDITNYDSRAFAKTWKSAQFIFDIGILEQFAKEENEERFKNEWLPLYGNKASFDRITKLSDYNKIKKVFETRVSKVVDSVRFIYKDDDTQTVRVMNRKKLKETYENIICKWVNEKGREMKKSFIDMWCEDADMKTYDKAINIPPPLVCPANTLNLWTPIKWSKCDMEGGEYKTVEDHILLLCGNRVDCQEHTIFLFASILQYPALKTGVMLIFVGEEGTGKNRLYDILKRLFGADKCLSTPNVGSKIFGQFANIWADKQIVVLNDFNPTEVKKENSERLKDYITETDVVLEKKNIDEFEGKQYAQFIAYSQSYTPIANNSGSRRFFQMECSREKIGDTDYFDKLSAWLEKDENIYAWYHRLMNIDLSKFKPSKFPITEVSLMAKQANATPVEAYLEERKSEVVSMIEYKKKTDDNKYIVKATSDDKDAFMCINHRAFFGKFKVWACGNIPEYQNYTMRKFQLEMYRLRARFGFEYNGDDKNPERSFWKITDKAKWTIEKCKDCKNNVKCKKCKEQGKFDYDSEIDE